MKKLGHWVFFGGLRFHFRQNCLLSQISFVLNVFLPNQQACCILRQSMDDYPFVALFQAKVAICYQKSEYLRKYLIKHSYLQTLSHYSHFRTRISVNLVAQKCSMIKHWECWCTNLRFPSSSLLSLWQLDGTMAPQVTEPSSLFT